MDGALRMGVVVLIGDLVQLASKFGLPNVFKHGFRDGVRGITITDSVALRIAKDPILMEEVDEKCGFSVQPVLHDDDSGVLWLCSAHQPECDDAPAVCDNVHEQTPEMAYQCGRLYGISLTLRAALDLVEASGGKVVTAGDVAAAVVAAVAADVGPDR